MVKDATHPSPTRTQSTVLRSAILDWSGVLTAGALIVVPLWMLLSNSAVLGGHPALPFLLSAALTLGLFWLFVLVKRSTLLERWSHNKARKLPTHQQTRRGVSRW